MEQRQYNRRLSFNQRQYQEMLLQMEARCGSAERAEGRVRPRYEYRIADIPLSITHPEGGTSHFLVFGRNISRSGISVLHGGFVHPGSSCRLELGQINGDPLTVTGEVRHCRLFSGSCHEIGIHFHQEIDPSALLGSDDDKEVVPEAETVYQIRKDSCILVTDSFAPDHLLLEHHLAVFGSRIIIAETPGAALDATKTETIDVVLFGLSLTGPDGLRTLQRIRETGYTGPVLVLTSEMELAETARKAGATAITSKPYNIDMLMAQVRVLLGDSVPHKPQFSTAANQPGMSPLIGRYVELVRRIADQVERLQAEANWEELLEYCRQLKGSGCGYGFQNITVAAISAINAVRIDAASESAGAAVQSLLECCRSVEFNETFSGTG